MPEGKRIDPFPAFRFDLKFERDSFGGFSDCSGLNLDTQVETYLEGGWNGVAQKFPGRTTQSNIVLKRGIVDAKTWDWYYRLTQGDVEFRSVTICVYDLGFTKVEIEFQLTDAFPCKWNGPELSAQQSAVAVETLELCHQGLQRFK